MDKVTKQCPQTTTFLKRKKSRSGIEPKSFREEEEEEEEEGGGGGGDDQKENQKEESTKKLISARNT